MKIIFLDIDEFWDVVKEYIDEKYLTNAINAGCKGYLLKTATQEELLSAIETVANVTKAPPAVTDPVDEINPIALCLMKSPVSIAAC